MKIKPFAKVAIAIYIFLTFIRFFTSLLNDQREENPTLIVYAQPCIETVLWCSDKAIPEYEAKYSWYRNEAYVELMHLNHYPFLEYTYYALIILWEILTILILATIIVMLLVWLKKRFFAKS